MTQADLSKRYLTSERSVFQLLLRFSVPTTLANLSTSLSSLADAVFLSQMGTSYSGAAGVLFPIFALIQAVGFTLGTGGGSVLARSLGAKDHEKANKVAAFSFWGSVAAGWIICAIGLYFRAPLLRWLGANDAILAGALPYAAVLFFAAPLMCGSFSLSNLLRAEGRVVWATVGTVAGNLLNILLTPLFLFRLRLGAKGVALALLIGYAVCFLLLLIPYFTGKCRVSLLPKTVRSSFGVAKETVVIGSPSLARQGLAMLAAVCLNRAARPYGVAAIAALAIEGRIFLLLYAFCLGIGQGMVPITGFLYGAGKSERAKTVSKIATSFCTALLAGLSLLTGIFAPRIIALFRSDPDVIRLGSFLLRAQCIAMPLHGIITIVNLYFQSIGSAKKALFIAASRQGIFFLPLIWILPRFGLFVLLLTQPIADSLTLIPILFFAKAKSRGRSPFAWNGKRPPLS